MTKRLVTHKGTVMLTWQSGIARSDNQCCCTTGTRIATSLTVPKPRTDGLFPSTLTTAAAVCTAAATAAAVYNGAVSATAAVPKLLLLLMLVLLLLRFGAAAGE
jgi:hypothetical protein